MSLKKLLSAATFSFAIDSVSAEDLNLEKSAAIASDSPDQSSLFLSQVPNFSGQINQILNPDFRILSERDRYLGQYFSNPQNMLADLDQALFDTDIPPLQTEILGIRLPDFHDDPQTIKDFFAAFESLDHSSKNLFLAQFDTLVEPNLNSPALSRIYDPDKWQNTKIYVWLFQLRSCLQKQNCQEIDKVKEGVEMNVFLQQYFIRFFYSFYYLKSNDFYQSAVIKDIIELMREAIENVKNDPNVNAENILKQKYIIKLYHLLSVIDQNTFLFYWELDLDWKEMINRNIPFWTSLIKNFKLYLNRALERDGQKIKDVSAEQTSHIVEQNREVLADLSAPIHSFSFAGIDLPQVSDSPEKINEFLQNVASLDYAKLLEFQINFSLLQQRLKIPDGFFFEISTDKWEHYKNNLWIESLREAISGESMMGSFSDPQEYFQTALQKNKLLALFQLHLRYGDFEAFKNLTSEIYIYSLELTRQVELAKTENPEKAISLIKIYSTLLAEMNDYYKTVSEVKNSFPSQVEFAIYFFWSQGVWPQVSEIWYNLDLEKQKLETRN